ncbi:SH3 domain-containing protein [Deferribacter abyssi]|uniref:SH3 domain-containing protein n=1 Tax=Deferribacter abyssi TaxID=213806 RepID=UPI003C1986F5
MSTKSKNMVRFLETLAKVKVSTYVYKQPNLKSKKLRRLYKGSKIIVIQDYNDKWYKVKYNNVRTGFVLKNTIELRYTLKKEVKKGPYQLKKLQIDLKSFIQRFNFNMTESKFFLDMGYVPNFKLKSVKKFDDTLRVELYYFWNIKKGVVVSKNENPFQDLIKQFLEVVFFKMFMERYRYYEIYVYDKNRNDKKAELYAKLRYTDRDNRFFEIKNFDGKIWDYIECNVSLNSLFAEIKR